MTAAAPLYSVVVPTVGRPSLARLLDGLAAQRGPRPQEVVVVDDRPDPSTPLLERSSWPYPLRVVRGWGRGPAAARNLGWRLTTTEWVEFLDDDVVLPAGWARTLAVDLALLAPDVGGSHRRRGDEQHRRQEGDGSDVLEGCLAGGGARSHEPS